MRNDKTNIIVEKSLEFAVRTIEYSEILEEKQKYARQLLRSGTSIGANVKEAQNAENRADFMPKMKIAAKEADETDYWLILCKRSKNYFYDEELHKSLNEIILLISKIISSSKKKSFSN